MIIKIRTPPWIKRYWSHSTPPPPRESNVGFNLAFRRDPKKNHTHETPTSTLEFSGEGGGRLMRSIPFYPPGCQLGHHVKLSRYHKSLSVAATDTFLFTSFGHHLRLSGYHEKEKCLHGMKSQNAEKPTGICDHKCLAPKTFGFESGHDSCYDWPYMLGKNLRDPQRSQSCLL